MNQQNQLALADSFMAVPQTVTNHEKRGGMQGRQKKQTTGRISPKKECRLSRSPLCEERQAHTTASLPKHPTQLSVANQYHTGCGQRPLLLFSESAAAQV